MGELTRVMAAVRRFAVWLLPGLSTVTLMIKSAPLRSWFYGSHLTAFGTYSHEFNAAQAGAYFLMCMAFPFVGLMMSSVAAAIANPAPRLPGPPVGCHIH